VGANASGGGGGALYDSTDSNEKGDDEYGMPMAAMARRYSSSDLENGIVNLYQPVWVKQFT